MAAVVMRAMVSATVAIAATHHLAAQPAPRAFDAWSTRCAVHVRTAPRVRLESVLLFRWLSRLPWRFLWAYSPRASRNQPGLMVAGDHPVATMASRLR
jgi:hypothetical protein